MRNGILHTAIRAIINTASARAAPQKRPREVQFVTYEAGNLMLKADVGWRLAPEEDTNKRNGWVWLERDK